MKTLGLILLAVVAILLLMSRCRSHPPTTLSPVTDAISADLDARTHADISVRVSSMRDQLKQMEAMGSVDESTARQELAQVDQLAKDIDAARTQLITRGAAPAETDAWIRKTQWGEVQQLAAHLRAGLAPSP